MKNKTFTDIKLHGETGKLIDNITKNFLVGIRETNPAILTMLRDRDVMPYRDLLPWSGEFAGKYLTSCAYVYRLNNSEVLRNYVIGFIDELLKYQDSDGYLGCYTWECHLNGKKCSKTEEQCTTWDAWSHYHIMYGLLSWYDITDNIQYFDAVERIAGLFINTFYNGKPNLISIGSNEMNLSVYHIFCILYRRTKNEKYIAFAKNVEHDLNSEGAGEYMRYALEGFEYYQCPKPRWESMHAIMGFLEMYKITEEKYYLEAVSQIFYSILKTDIHNTGAFSTDEQAIGTPFRNGFIETCCVVAFNALAVELYKITRDIKIIDFLEISHYNAVLGYCSPSGYWSTYNTPMDGEKVANTQTIVFQSRPGSPSLNCCSVNAPRGAATIGDWIIFEDTTKNILYINTYEALDCETTDGTKIKITGEYPVSGNIKICVDCGNRNQAVAFRIPKWSANTIVTIGDKEYTPAAGSYFKQKIKGSVVVNVKLNFTPYTITGSDEYAEKYSVYAGPVLYGFENSENPKVPFDTPINTNAEAIITAKPMLRKDGSIILTLSDGVILKDFYHLGQDGGRYRTWL